MSSAIYDNFFCSASRVSSMATNAYGPFPTRVRIARAPLRLLPQLFLVCLLLASVVSGQAEVGDVAGAGDLDTKIENLMAEKRAPERLKRMVELGGSLNSTEILPALAVADGLKQLRERAVLQGAVLKRWSELSPAKAFDYIADLQESRLKVESLRIATDRLAKTNTVAAATAVDKLRPGRGKNDAVEVLAEVWAQQDLKAAWRWAQALPDGFAKETALNRVRFTWVHADPIGAVDLVQTLAPGDLKNALITNLAGSWATLDPHGAIKWAEALPNGPEKDLALANVAEAWADDEPEEAGDFALKLPAQELRQRAAVAVVSRWATQDPRQAAAWLLKVTDPVVQQRGLAEIMNMWAAVSPVEAGEWIKQLTPSSVREGAIQSYLEAVNVWAPEMGVRVALKTTDEDLRRTRVEQSLQRWRELDPVAATQWLEKNPPVTSKAPGGQ